MVATVSDLLGNKKKGFSSLGHHCHSAKQKNELVLPECIIPSMTKAKIHCRTAARMSLGSSNADASTTLWTSVGLTFITDDSSVQSKQIRMTPTVWDSSHSSRTTEDQKNDHHRELIIFMKSMECLFLFSKTTSNGIAPFNMQPKDDKFTPNFLPCAADSEQGLPGAWHPCHHCWCGTETAVRLKLQCFCHIGCSSCSLTHTCWLLAS